MTTETLEAPEAEVPEAEAEPTEAEVLGKVVYAAMVADGVPPKMAEVLGSFHGAIETLTRLAEIRASLPAFVESAKAIMRLADDGLAEYPPEVLPAVSALVEAATAHLTTTLPRAGGTRSTRAAGERSTTGGFNLPAGSWLQVEDSAGTIVIVEGKSGNPRWDSLGSRFKTLLNGQTLRQAYPDESTAARDALCSGSLAAVVGDYTIRVVSA